MAKLAFQLGVFIRPSPLSSSRWGRLGLSVVLVEWGVGIGSIIIGRFLASEAQLPKSSASAASLNIAPARPQKATSDRCTLSSAPHKEVPLLILRLPAQSR